MANRVKKNPRTSCIICRLTKDEKKSLENEAKSKGYTLSKYTRKLFGFVEENE